MIYNNAIMLIYTCQLKWTIWEVRVKKWGKPNEYKEITELPIAGEESGIKAPTGRSEGDVVDLTTWRMVLIKSSMIWYRDWRHVHCMHFKAMRFSKLAISQSSNRYQAVGGSETFLKALHTKQCTSRTVVETDCKRRWPLQLVNSAILSHFLTNHIYRL